MSNDVGSCAFAIHVADVGEELIVASGRRPRVTLRDVAERAGVSGTTVSFVLSGRRDMRISSVTEERVLQAARMLGYRRLAPRTTLRRGAPAVGFISDTVATEAFAGEMIRGAIAAAAEYGHTLLMAESEGVRSLEVSAIQNLLQRGVEKFVYASMSTTNFAVPQALRHQQIVMLNGFDRRTVAHAVIPDDRQAGRKAAEELIAAGHTARIWLVGEVPGGLAARQRLNGIRAGLRTSGLHLAGHVQCAWWPEQTRQAVASILNGGRRLNRPSALIAMNDRTAMGIYQAASTAGLDIPDDLSVISFDNSDLARWLTPGLSSLAVPYFDLGRKAVELLLSDAPEPRVHKVPMPLRSRESVAAPAPAGALRQPNRRLSPEKSWPPQIVAG